MDRFVLNMLGFLIYVNFAIKIDFYSNKTLFWVPNVPCFSVMQSPAPSEDTLKPNFQAPSLNLKTMYTIMVYKPKPIIKKFNNLMYTCINQDSQQRKAYTGSCTWKEKKCQQCDSYGRLVMRLLKVTRGS